MPRVYADLTKCQGYASCVIADPDTFDLSDAGRVEILNPTPKASASLQDAVASCPMAALRLEG